MVMVDPKFVNEVFDVRSVIAIYDFSIQGGAQGNIDLIDQNANPISMPVNILIKNMFIEVIDATTSGGVAGIEIQGPAAAFTVINGADNGTFNSVGSVVASNQITSDPATYFRSVATGAPYITISGNDLTAGKLYVYIEYVQSIA